MASKSLYKITFLNAGKVYELYARSVSSGALWGFTEVRDLVFAVNEGLVVDPTEGTQEIGAETRSGGFLTRISQSLDYAGVLWNNYVVGLNPKVQRQGIYEPLAAGLEAAVDNVTSAQRWHG